MWRSSRKERPRNGKPALAEAVSWGCLSPIFSLAGVVTVFGLCCVVVAPGVACVDATGCTYVVACSLPSHLMPDSRGRTRRTRLLQVIIVRQKPKRGIPYRKHLRTKPWHLDTSDSTTPIMLCIRMLQIATVCMARRATEHSRCRIRDRRVLLGVDCALTIIVRQAKESCRLLSQPSATQATGLLIAQLPLRQRCFGVVLLRRTNRTAKLPVGEPSGKYL